MHHAVMCARPEAAKLLIRRGAGLAATDASGRTALDVLLEQVWGPHATIALLGPELSSLCADIVMVRVDNKLSGVVPELVVGMQRRRYKAGEAFNFGIVFESL